MAELSPSWSWLRAWCKADMALPRRSGWMFSLLSSHSTSPPSAMVELKTTRWLQPDRNRCNGYVFGFLSVLIHYGNLVLQLFSSTLVMFTKYTWATSTQLKFNFRKQNFCNILTSLHSQLKNRNIYAIYSGNIARFLWDQGKDRQLVSFLLI